jgi:hypothetical protein
MDLTAALLAVPPDRPLQHNPAINPATVEQGLDFGAHTRWLLQASARFLKDCTATVRSLLHHHVVLNAGDKRCLCPALSSSCDSYYCVHILCFSG